MATRTHHRRAAGIDPHGGHPNGGHAFVVDREMKSALQRYRDAGIDAPIIQRGGRDVLTYAACGRMAAGMKDVMAMTPGDELPIVTWAVSTDQVDRTNDRMNIDGVQLRHYLDNPVILWNHDTSIPPIAKGLKPRVSVLDDGAKSLLLDIQFNCVTQLGREVGMLVMMGDLKTTSIGFIPLSAKDEPASKYPDAYPFLQTVRTYETWEKLESSICSIPMNPGALRQKAYDPHALDPEFEARLRERVHSGLISHDGNGIVRALGGNAAHWSQQQYTPTMKQAGTIDPAPIATFDVAGDGGGPDNPHAERKQYTSIWEGGAVFARIVDPLAAEVLRYTESIDDADLTVAGRDSEIIIPLYRGITAQNVDVVIAAVKGAQAFDVVFGETRVETGDEWCDHDTLYLDIVAPGALDIRKQLDDTIRGWCWPWFSDSVAIHLAELKTGRGAAYAGSDQLSGRSAMIDELVYRDIAGEETLVPLAATTKSLINSIGKFTMSTVTKQDPPMDPNQPAGGAPPGEQPAPAAAPTEAEENIQGLQGLDYDLALLTMAREDLKELATAAGYAGTNSQSDSVKAFATALIEASVKVDEAAVKILTELGVALEDEGAGSGQPAGSQAPPPNGGAPQGGNPQGAAQNQAVQASYRKALEWIVQLKAGRAISAYHGGLVVTAHDALSILRKAYEGDTLDQEKEITEKALRRMLEKAGICGITVEDARKAIEALTKPGDVGTESDDKYKALANDVASLKAIIEKMALPPDTGAKGAGGVADPGDDDVATIDWGDAPDGGAPDTKQATSTENPTPDEEPEIVDLGAILS